MDFDFKYVSAACPELTESEVRVLLEHLRDDARYSSATVPVIRTIARGLFPSIKMNNPVSYFDGRERIEVAIKYLNYAYGILDTIPQQVLTDGTAMTMIDINAAVHYLGEELDKLAVKKERDFT